MKCTERLERVLAVTLPVKDILEQRVDDASVPSWCAKRDWASFLLALDETALRRGEAHGLAELLPSLAEAPPDLRALARDVTTATALPMLSGATALSTESLRSVRFRKRAQLSGLLSAVTNMAEGATRIVDVGAGSGHFTRLSAELFQRDALGLERNPERVARAQQRAEKTAVTASFVAVDARDTLQFTERDLAIGLHACGELGDRLIQAVARARCDLALVSCCLQKISTSTRKPLSSCADAPELRREHLGLTSCCAHAASCSSQAPK